MLKQEEYIMAFELLAQSNKACVVVDIKASAIREVIEKIELGTGSILGFITQNGRELVREELEEGQTGAVLKGEPVFYQQDFYRELMESEEAYGAQEVTYNKNQYLLIYCRSEMIPATVCALVPSEIITKQAQDIRSMMVLFLAISVVIILIVGIIIVNGIQNNMKRISGKLGEVAGGDLTVQVRVKGRDEFQGLADSATNMVSNTKKLVNKVSGATNQLENSAKEVNRSSEIINEYSQEITRSIDEINEGMSRQSEHALVCVEKTDVLSNEIQLVSQTVDRVEKLVDETEEMINQGMEIMQLLGERARQTTEITMQVGDSIVSLKNETSIINSFVEAIAEITSKTNLLSLNASIEAARAGEFGRGFAVVAEEIRNLAESSAAAANEISINVKQIDVQTNESVNSAKKAQEMVTLQGKAVEQAVQIFADMRESMNQLIHGLQEIAVGTERADEERGEAVIAVKNISDIIEETAVSAENVSGIANSLLEHVTNLEQTADVFNQNMGELKNEIAVFKV